MTRTCYINFRFRGQSEKIIERANAIIAEYQAQGYNLTLRQLYYQMVARDIIPNNFKSYKRLGDHIARARLAGMIDWEAIEDLTRELRSVNHWNSPHEILHSAAQSFRVDKWQEQEFRPEVWVEKDALRSIVERVCTRHDVPFFSCRGYPSWSELWTSAQRFEEMRNDGAEPVILHLGDHDPSGIDMTRDIEARLRVFEIDVEVRRLALNMDQVRVYNPPPNPAKHTDSRFKDYEQKHGKYCWELDALDPNTLTEVIEKEIECLRDDELWEKYQAQEAKMRKELATCAERWPEVSKFLNKPQQRKRK